MNETNKNLKKLGLTKGQLKDLSSIKELRLDSISEIPKEIKLLASLERLYLAGTQVSDVSPLSGLTSLEWLYLAGTQVSDVSPLSGLPNLEIMK